MGPLAGRGGFDDSQGWTQEEDDTLEEEMAGGPDFTGTHAKIDDGGGVWECLFPDEQQHSAQSARSVAAPTSADEQPEVWEQMRTEWIEDGEKEYLDSIGCPRVGHSIQPLLRRRRRKNGLASTFDIVVRAESSGDELIEAAVDSDGELLPALAYSDDELVLEAGDNAHKGRDCCRGEQEQVLGKEVVETDWLRWSLATGTPHGGECPSSRKVDPHATTEDQEPPMEEQVAGPRPKWKPMSAVKIREAAKNRASKLKIEERQGEDAKADEARAMLWNETFDSPDEWSSDDAKDQYASWVRAGRPGLDSKEEPFIPAESYDGKRKGWVFKTSTLGTGYHREGVRSGAPIQLHRMIWPTAEVAPVRLMLDQLVKCEDCIGDPVKATAEEEPEPVDGKKQRHKLAKKKYARNKVAARAKSECTGKLTVDFKDTSHREEGWWAVDSINANAWEGATEAMMTTAADAVGVQEARVELNAVKDCESTM